MEECAVLKEIDRPLGQGLPPLAKPKRRIGIQRSTIISVAAAVAILAVSSAIALREDGLERPAPPVVVAEAAGACTGQTRQGAGTAETCRTTCARRCRGFGPVVRDHQGSARHAGSPGKITVSDPSAVNFNPARLICLIAR
jgi:hypothetical protein